MPSPSAAASIPLASAPITPRRPLRILALWAAADYDEFFRPAFLDRPEYEVEIVSGHRTSGPSKNPMTLARFRELKARLARGEFDLVISGSIWNTPWPRNKSFWTSLSVGFRFWVIKRGMLDTYWAPWLMEDEAVRAAVPFAVLDLRDSPNVLPWDWPLLQSATLYFKRELFPWHWKSLASLRIYQKEREVNALVPKLRPLSYGVRASHLVRPSRPMAERDVDIFMSGSSNELRGILRARCEALAGKYHVVLAPGFLPESDYDEMLQRAKLVVCVESFGCETWRQYEVAAAGAIPLMNWPSTSPHEPFRPDEQAVYFSLLGDDFERQISRVLASPELLQKISDGTRAHVLAHKDRSKIGDYVVRTTLEYWRKNGPGRADEDDAEETEIGEAQHG